METHAIRLFHLPAIFFSRRADHKHTIKPYTLPLALLFFLWLSGPALLAQQTYIVTKVNDTNGTCVAGDCSLREAITAANLDGVASVIKFDFATGSAPFLIAVRGTPLPQITSNDLIIDGLLDNSYSLGDVIIDGSLLAGAPDGLSVMATEVTIAGLQIQNFGGNGISAGVTFGAINVGIFDNILIDNGGAGIFTPIHVNLDVDGNYIGTNPSFASGLGNGGFGINYNSFASGTPPTLRITNNFIGSNTGGGIQTNGTVDFFIDGNTIGTNAAGTGNLGNNNSGITISNNGDSGTISNNTIAFSGTGIFAEGSTPVVISRNEIYCNAFGGLNRDPIVLQVDITSATPTVVSGTSNSIGGTVELFLHDLTGCSTPSTPCQGKTFIGTTNTTLGGDWTLDVTGLVNSGDVLTATVTTFGATRTTSEFAACVTINCSVISANIDATPSCVGANSGSLTANPTGGTGPYIYRWSTGATTQTISNLPPGNYDLTVVDANGCLATDSGEVIELAGPVVDAGPDQLICDGDETTLTATASGGVGPYLFDWDNGDSGASITVRPTVATTYTVTVTDTQGCTDEDQVLVRLAPAPDQPDAGPDQTLCAGETASLQGDIGGDPTAPGIWTASVPGGSFSPDATTLNATYTAPTGTTTVTLTLSTTNGNAQCPDLQDEMTITYTPGIIVDAGPDQTLCLNAPATLAGSISANGTSGGWSASVAGGSFSPNNLALDAVYTPPTGATSVTLTLLGVDGSGSGCPDVRDQMIITYVPSDATVDAGPNQVICAGDVLTLSGAFGGSATGAQWSTDGDGTFANTNDPTTTYTPGPNDISNQGATLTLTALSGGACPPVFDVMDFRITPAPTYTVSGIDPTSCTNPNGNILISGLIPGQTYEVSYIFAGALNQLSQNASGAGQVRINNLTSGTYSDITVTDAIGCSGAPENVTLNAPDGPIASADPVSICEGGTGEISGVVTGGTPPYTHAWLDQGTGSATGYVLSNTGAQTLNIDAAAAEPGTIDLLYQVTDSGGCQSSVAVSVTIEPAPAFPVSGTDPTSCTGPDGSFTISGLAPGATYDVTYVFAGATVPIAQNASGTGEITVGNLTAGTYSDIIVTDQNGCISQPATVILNSPDGPAVSADPVSICEGGTGEISGVVTGGTPPYTHAWLDQGTGSATGYVLSNTDAQTLNIDAAAAQAGTIDLLYQVTDSGGCQSSVAVSVTIEPAPVFPVSGTDPTSCTGPDGSFTISGLTPGAAYDVTYVFAGATVPIAQNASGAGEITVGNLTAGTYSDIIVTDQNGCVSQPATVILNSPDGPAVSADPVSICEGGTGEISGVVTGGTPPYTHAWLDQGTGSATGYVLSNTGAQTLNIDAAAAQPGTIDLLYQVTDSGGCQSSVAVSVTIEPAPVFPVNGTDPTSCTGPDGSFTISGLTPGAAYDVTYVFAGATVPVAQNASGAGEITVGNLTAGTYTDIIVTDQNGCVSQPATIILNSPDGPVVSADPISICEGGTGEISGVVTGGTPPYTHAWLDQGTGSATGYVLSNTDAQTLNIDAAAQAGTIDLLYQVTDSGGCQASVAVSVTIETTPAFPVSGTDPTSCTSPDGSFTISGLTPGAAYDITYVFAGATVPVAQNASGAGEIIVGNLTAGTYTDIVVTDQNGCVSQPATAILNSPDGPVASADPVSICEGGTGEISGVVTGGTPPYTHAWLDQGTGSATGYVLSNTDAQTLNIDAATAQAGTVDLLYQVTDSGGCQASVAVSVTIETTPAFPVSGTDPTSCTSPDGSFLISGLNPGAAYDISYVFEGATVPSAQNASAAGEITVGSLTAGTYSDITVTGGNGCVSQPATVILNSPDGPVASADPISICAGGSGEISGGVTGGTPPYTHAWLDQGTGSATGYVLSNTDAQTLNIDAATAQAGTIDLLYQVTDSGGCQTAVAVSVTIETTPAFPVSGTDPTSCTSPDGSFLISGLNPGEPYDISYLFEGATITLVQDASAVGEIAIENLVAGTYSNIIVADGSGCTSNPETVILNSPDGPTIGADPVAICEGGIAEISGSVSGGTSPYTHEWLDQGTGSASGYLLSNTSDQTMNIDAGSAQAGTVNLLYRVMDSGGCESSIPVVVNIVPAPTMSVVQIDSASTSIATDGQITIDVSEGLAPYTYSWAGPVNGSSTLAAADNIVIGNLSAGIYDILLEDANGCSTTLRFRIGIRPAGGGDCTTSAGSLEEVSNGGIQACSSSSVELVHNQDQFLDANDALVFVLKEISGTVIKSNPVPVFDFDPAVMTINTQYFAAARAGNAAGGGGGGVDPADPCLSESNSIEIVFRESLSGVLNFIQGEEQLCQGEELILSTNNLGSIDYFWITPNRDTIRTNEPMVILSDIQTLDAGDYYVIARNGDCLNDQTGPFSLIVSGLPVGSSICAGDDQTVCDRTVNLQACDPGPGNGTWTSLSGALIGNPSSPNTTASELAPGENLFVWTVTIPECGSIGSDTVRVLYESSLFAQPDNFILERANSEIFMDVLKNDNIASGADIELTALTQPAFGILETLPNGFRFYETEQRRGLVEFVYQVCYLGGTCMGTCDTATVRIDVLNLPYLPEGITPDGDGINDELIVLGYTPGNSDLRLKLTIANQWGEIVYQSNDYTNADPWKGTYKGKKVPQGAYYCHLETIVPEDSFERTQTIYVVR